MLTWLAMLVFLSMAIVSSTLDPLVRHRFAAIDSAASTFMSIHSIPQLLLIGILSGFFSDRLRRRYPLILPSLLITGVCTALLPIVDHFPTLLAIRFVDGMTGIIAIGLIMARILDLSSKSNSRGFALGFFLFCVPLGYLTAMVLTYFLSTLGLNALFLTVGTIIFFSAFLIVPYLYKSEEISETDLTMKDFFRSFKRVPQLWPALLFGFADKFTFAAIAMLTSLIAADVYGISDPKSVSLALALYFFGCLLFSAVSGFLTQKIGAKKVIIVGSTVYALSLISLPHMNFQWFLVMMFVAGCLTAFQFVPTLDLLGSLSRSSDRGVNTQLFNFAGSLGFIVGFPILHIMTSIDSSYRLAYGVTGGVEILAVLIAGFTFTIYKLRGKKIEHQDPAFTSAQALSRSVS